MDRNDEGWGFQSDVGLNKRVASDRPTSVGALMMVTSGVTRLGNLGFTGRDE